MADSKKPPKSPRDYDVGYGKPPRKNRFQSGQSGNPNGRPPRKKSLSEIFREVANMPVTVSEGEKKRRISTEKAIFLKLRQAALGGESKAQDRFLKLMHDHAPAEATATFIELLEEDRRLLAELKRAANKPSDGGSDDVAE